MRRRLALLFLLMPLCGCNNVQQMFGFGSPSTDDQAPVENVSGEDAVDEAPTDEASSEADTEAESSESGTEEVEKQAGRMKHETTTDEQTSVAAEETAVTGVRKGEKVGVKKGAKRETTTDEAQPVDDAAAQQPATEEAPAPDAEPVSYGGFTSDVIGNGHKSMLFFYAPWCPYCQDDDVILTRLYQGGTPEISTYKVDFDTEFDLRDRYGVVSQHTFVLIDGEGNMIDSYYNPSSADFPVYLKE